MRGHARPARTVAAAREQAATGSAGEADSVAPGGTENAAVPVSSAGRLRRCPGDAATADARWATPVSAAGDGALRRLAGSGPAASSSGEDPAEHATHRTARPVMTTLRGSGRARSAEPTAGRSTADTATGNLRRWRSAGGPPTIRRKLDPLAVDAAVPEQQTRIAQAKVECARHIEALKQSTHPNAPDALQRTSALVDRLNPGKTPDMRDVKGGKARTIVNEAIAILNANIDQGLVPDAPPPIIASKQDLKSERKDKAQQGQPQPAIKDLNAEILRRAKTIKLPAPCAFRANTAAVARKYLLDGFGIVHNDAKERQLGPGLYAGMQFKYAQAYVDRLKDLPAIIQLDFTTDAEGIEIKPTDMELLDGQGVGAIEQIYQNFDFIYCNDAEGGQIKFHPRYYLKKIAIGQVWVRTNKAQNTFQQYPPDRFLDEYETSHVSIRTAEAKKLAMQPKPPRPGEPVGDARSPALQQAPDAERWMIESIHYRDSAELFEANLARYAGGHPLALQEAAKLATFVWKLFPDPGDRSSLGTEERGNTGMVGKVRSDLEKVARSGNLREQMALLYNGYTSRLFTKLNAGKELMRPKAFEVERQDRLNLPDVGSRTSVNPLDVTPPLSRAEWLSAVDNKGQLGWEPGERLYHFRMASEFQKVAEGKGALVSSGTSGTAFGILQAAALIGQMAGVPVDYFAVRLALLGWMLSAGDHTFHEIMLASEMFDKALFYDNTFRRYRSITPLSEAELRQYVADQKQFPDEYLQDTIHEVACFNLLVQAIGLLIAGEPAKASAAHQKACAEFPQATWSARLTELQDVFDKVSHAAQLAVQGDVPGSEQLRQTVRDRARKYGIAV